MVPKRNLTFIFEFITYRFAPKATPPNQVKNNGREKKNASKKST